MAELRVVRASERDRSTAQTPGMDRAEGVGGKTVGAERIWLGYVSLGPGVKSGAHHHGEVESAIYIISGNARFRFGDRLERAVEAGPGDFVFVPPYLVHQETNASDQASVEMIVGRSSLENIVVNVEIAEGAREG